MVLIVRTKILNLTIFITILLLFLASCNQVYEYEYCFADGRCERNKAKFVSPSMEYYNVCNPDYSSSGARAECEKVPKNRLLLKGGTDKKYCNGHYNPDDFLDNYWNAEGLIDECEITVGGNEQFIFKQHDQSVRSHTGTIQVKLNILNYDNDYKAMQVFRAEDNNNDNLPDEWKYCGNVDGIKGYVTRYIHCDGNNLKFVKVVNAEWNKGSLYLDLIEVLKT